MTKTITLTEIRTAAQRLADAHHVSIVRAKLLESTLHEAVTPIYESHRAGIDAAAEEEAAAREELQRLIDQAPGLFKKPRSLTVDGVKCGYRKENDTLDWDETAAVVARIRSLDETADLEAVLIRTEETLNIAALDELEPAILRRIGVRRVNGSDAPFISHTDSDVEKMVKAILADAARRQGEDEVPKAKGKKAKVPA